MERLGTVERVAQGLAVVGTDDRVPIGRSVVDEDLEDVGSVVDVFGPVDAPYAAVAPDADVHLAALVGKPLYVR